MARLGQATATELIWQPLARRVLLSERIVAEIEKVILDQRLNAGDRLPREIELAKHLGVSRASLREAIKTLEAQGRLDVKHGRGIFVRQSGPLPNPFMNSLKIDPVDLGELFSMREILEVPAAGWAAQSGDASALLLLRESLMKLDEAGARRPLDLAELQRLDATFHMRIAEASGNKLLVRTMRVLQDILAVSLHTTHLIPGRLERSRRDHRRILKAILAHDAKAAERAMLTHLVEVRRAALSAARWPAHSEGDGRVASRLPSK